MSQAKISAAIVVAVMVLIGTGCKLEGGKEDPGAKPAPASPKPGAPETKPAATAPAEQAAQPGQGKCQAAGAMDGLTAVRPPAGQAPADGDVLNRRLPAEPANLNPITATDIYEKAVNYNLVIERLLETDLATGEFKPMLAESYEVAEDKMTFTFHLRPGVTFHDGHPFDADDVIYTLDRVLDPKVDAASLRSYFIDCESYQKIDDHIVRIKWKRPYFKALEMIGDLDILPKHILDDGTDFNKHPYNRKPVGTGPYRLVEWSTGQKVVLERYPGYWGPKPHFDRMVYKVMTDDEVAFQVAQQGELDSVSLTSLTWVQKTNSADFKERFNKLHYPYPQFGYIGWNLRKPIFADKRTRQALAMLLDRESILASIFNCLGRVAHGTFDPNSPFNDPTISPWPFDPARAKALLSEAGWKDADGDGVLDHDGTAFRFELAFTADSPDTEAMAVLYKEELKKAGIEMEIRKFEWATFLQNVQEWKFDASIMGWALDFDNDPYQLWHSSQADVIASSNHVGFKNAEVDRLIEENRGDFDRQKRIERCRQIDRILHEEQPYLFLFNLEALGAMNKRIQNVVPYPIRPIFYYTQWYVPKELQKPGAASTP